MFSKLDIKRREPCNISLFKLERNNRFLCRDSTASFKNVKDVDLITIHAVRHKTISGQRATMQLILEITDKYKNIGSYLSFCC